MTEVKKWSKFSGEKADIIKELFLAGESMNVNNFVKFFTDDALYQFSSFPVEYGPEGIKRSSVDFLEKVEGLHHHIKNIWELEDDTASCELEVTYVRYDGKVFTLPCSDIIRFKGEKIQEMFIYMDIRPVYDTPMEQQELRSEKASRNGLTNVVKDLFAAAYANDLDKYVTFFTEDAIYKAGNTEAVIGWEGIREFATPVMQRFRTVDHRIAAIWEVNDTVICKGEVVYSRNDGNVFKVPTSNIIRFKGDKIRKLQAFGDPSSAFA